MQSTHYSCQISMKFEFRRQVLEKKHSNIKFHKNPFSGSRVVSYGETDMTKQMVYFRHFANEPKNGKRILS